MNPDTTSSLASGWRPNFTYSHVNSGKGTVSLPTSPLRHFGEAKAFPWDEATAQPSHSQQPAPSSTISITPPFDWYTATSSQHGPSSNLINPQSLSPINPLSPFSPANRHLYVDGRAHVQAQAQHLHTVPGIVGLQGVPPPKKKRAQVRVACTHCQKACKKCSNTRPCERCVKYGFEDCVDSTRKPRKSGVKRGPYKRRTSQYPPQPVLPIYGGPSAQIHNKNNFAANNSSSYDQYGQPIFSRVQPIKNRFSLKDASTHSIQEPTTQQNDPAGSQNAQSSNDNTWSNVFASALNGPRWLNGQRQDPKQMPFANPDSRDELSPFDNTAFNNAIPHTDQDKVNGNDPSNNENVQNSITPFMNPFTTQSHTQIARPFPCGFQRPSNPGTGLQDPFSRAVSPLGSRKSKEIFKSSFGHNKQFYGFAGQSHAALPNPVSMQMVPESYNTSTPTQLSSQSNSGASFDSNRYRGDTSVTTSSAPTGTSTPIAFPPTAQVSLPLTNSSDETNTNQSPNLQDPFGFNIQTAPASQTTFEQIFSAPPSPRPTFGVSQSRAVSEGPSTGMTVNPIFNFNPGPLEIPNASVISPKSVVPPLQQGIDEIGNNIPNTTHSATGSHPPLKHANTHPMTAAQQKSRFCQLQSTTPSQHSSPGPFPNGSNTTTLSAFFQAQHDQFSNPTRDPPSQLQSPALIALKRIRKPSLRTLMVHSNTTSRASSPESGAHTPSGNIGNISTAQLPNGLNRGLSSNDGDQSPTLFDQPLNLLDGDDDHHSFTSPHPTSNQSNQRVRDRETNMGSAELGHKNEHEWEIVHEHGSLGANGMDENRRYSLSGLGLGLGSAGR